MEDKIMMNEELNECEEVVEETVDPDTLEKEANVDAARKAHEDAEAKRKAEWEAKKKAKEILFEIVNKGEDFLTNVLVCEGTAQVLTPEDVYIKCKSGTRLEGNFKYYDTFYFDNVIYGLFNNIEDENSFEIVKILPRYQGYVIESEEEFTKLINIYKELGR